MEVGLVDRHLVFGTRGSLHWQSGASREAVAGGPGDGGANEQVGTCPAACSESGSRQDGFREVSEGNTADINNLRYADDTTLMAESEEELKSLLMKVKEESEKSLHWFVVTI